MPNGQPLGTEIIEQIIALQAGGTPKATIATQLRLPRRTVRDVLTRHAARVELSRPAQTEHQLIQWNAAFNGASEKLRDIMDGEHQGSTTDQRNYTIMMGISQEKILLLTGQPTQIVAGLHEVRHQLGPLLERLHAVNERVGRTILEPRQIDGVTVLAPAP